MYRQTSLNPKPDFPQARQQILRVWFMGLVYGCSRMHVAFVAGLFGFNYPKQVLCGRLEFRLFVLPAL